VTLEPLSDKEQMKRVKISEMVSLPLSSLEAEHKTQKRKHRKPEKKDT
jgi:hypothetical protein